MRWSERRRSLLWSGRLDDGCGAVEASRRNKSFTGLIFTPQNPTSIVRTPALRLSLASITFVGATFLRKLNLEFHITKRRFRPTLLKMQAFEGGRARTSGRHKATEDSDGLDESIENLRRLAWHGWIVAVIPDDSTGRDHCVEAYIDSKRRPTLRVRRYDLSGKGDNSHSVIRSSPINLKDIERTYHGRFVGHFQEKRNDSWDYLERWLRDPVNFLKGHDKDNAYKIETILFPWIMPDCIFASRGELGAEVWLGNLDNLSMSVDGCDPLHVILEEYQNTVVTSVAKGDENVRPVFLSTESHPNKEGNHRRVQLWPICVQNWKCVSSIPTS